MKARKVWLVCAMLVATAGLMVGATSASAAKKGGTLRINSLSPFDYVDPALTYFSLGWAMEYATCVKLVNYPDKGGPAVASTLIPEAAVANPVVSKDGKTYTFTIRKNAFKFSPPSKEFVTPGSFKFSIERLADPNMQSPAAPFLGNIVGAQEKVDGKAKSISGITTKGQKLIIKLKTADPSLLAQLAMPFFCSLPKNTPNDPQGVLKPSSAGPYYITDHVQGKSLTLSRNPNYKGKRPHNFDKIVYKFGVAQAATLLEVKSGAADYAADGVPPAEYSGLWNQYGPTSKAGKSGKQQFFVNPEIGVQYLAMNMERPLFGKNANLRKAVNHAVNRPAMIKVAGAYAGKVTDQVLPPGMPGFVDIKAYPLQAPDVAKAKGLAGNTKSDMVLYTSTSPISTARAAVIQSTLKEIGLDVNVKAFPRGTQIVKEGTRGEPFDMTTEGWIADYNDPYDFINILLDGSTLRESNNNNVAYFNDPGFNSRMAKAAKTTGAARTTAYAQLDNDITTKGVPWAAYMNFTNREFFSGRVGCYNYTPAYASMNLAALCLR
jgi:ABC-type oligopeptide transport system substrate-binding subunit